MEDLEDGRDLDQEGREKRHRIFTLEQYPDKVGRRMANKGDHGSFKISCMIIHPPLCQPAAECL